VSKLTRLSYDTQIMIVMKVVKQFTDNNSLHVCDRVWMV
jgi:hypothetical protein